MTENWDHYDDTNINKFISRQENGKHELGFIHVKRVSGKGLDISRSKFG